MIENPNVVTYQEWIRHSSKAWFFHFTEYGHHKPVTDGYELAKIQILNNYLLHKFLRATKLEYITRYKTEAKLLWSFKRVPHNMRGAKRLHKNYGKF